MSQAVKTDDAVSFTICDVYIQCSATHEVNFSNTVMRPFIATVSLSYIQSVQMSSEFV